MITIFLSCVSSEFGGYRRSLKSKLETTKLKWLVQEEMTDSRFDTLLKLDEHIRNCTTVIHIVGRGAGAPANGAALRELLGTPDFEHFQEFAQTNFGAAIADDEKLSYTQWEVVLAAFRQKPLFVFEASCPITDGHAIDKNRFE